MGGNRCYSSFLPLTNQVFQQPLNNNYNQTPITQQLITSENQNHGFRDSYEEDDQQKFDRAEQQKRIWVDQHISSHYQQCREKMLIGHSNAVPSETGSISLPFFPAVNFSSGHKGNNENALGVSGEDDEDDLLKRGSEQYRVFEGRNTSNLTVPTPHCWHAQEDSSIIQSTFWRPLLTELLNGNNKGCKEAEETKEVEHEQNQNKRFKFSEKALPVDEPRNNLENKCRLAGDLEVVYGRSASDHETNQIYVGPVDELKTFCGDGVEKETSKDAKKYGNYGREKSKSDNSQMESMVVFFKSLVDRIMEHQESLHRSFLETMERLDGERREREEAWRRQELARLNEEATSREHEQALVSSREATIVSYLEKIVGQGIVLPNKIAQDSDTLSTKMNKRWPKVEVEALIRVRTSLEPKFHDAAMKAFVWEDISKIMVSMGYRRSAQRCKEKWENINRYFKKLAKENSGLQYPKKHKACPYFEQLNEFHTAKSFPKGSNSSSSSLSLSSNLQGKISLFSTGSFKEIQLGCNANVNKELNHKLEGNKDEDVDEDQAEDEEDDDDDDGDGDGSADD